VYGPFLSAPAAHGLIRIDNSLIEQTDGRYVVNYDTFEEQIIQNKVKLFILCNPHNPVGRVFKRDELLRMAEICLAHDVIICSDDIHCDLIYKGFQHVPMASLSEEIASRTITLIAPSKTFNIAGLHASVVIFQDKKLKDAMNTARHGLVSNPGSLSLVAALAAYREGGAWLKEALAYLEANRDWLVNAVAEKLPGVKMFRPEGTYLAWLDCRGLQIPSDPYHYFLEKARVGLNDGLEYGEDGRGYVRLNFGTPRSLLEAAIERMHDALKAEGLI
jgi:cystathionine beta-lyase